jgi:tetratricopeptide (TPR) repeat protein
MPVTGDTKSLDLSDLLQTFEAHQKSCTLDLVTETGPARLRIRSGAFAALAFGGRPRLVDRLVAWKLVSARQVENARRRRGRSRRAVGAFLVESGALTAEQLREAGQQSLVEDLSDLIANGASSFELREDGGDARPADAADVLEEEAEERPDAAPSFDPDERALALSIPVGATLLEAARRSDHWARVRKSIPSDTATYIARENVALPADFEDPELAARLFASLDGTRTVKEATQDCARDRLAAYDCLLRFVRDRLVRIASAEDLFALATTLEKSSPQHARPLVERGLEAEPHHLGLLALGARLAKRGGDPKGAAATFKLMAHVFSESGDTERARRALVQARTHDPSDAATGERILELDLEEGRFHEAVEVGMQLVALYRKPGLHSKAREVLERLVEAEPQSLPLRLEWARSEVDSGDPDEAIEGLTRHGRKLVSHERYVEARQVFEEILAIRPTQKDARRALEMIDQQIYQRRRARARRVRRFAIGTLVATALAALLVREFVAQADLAETSSAVAHEELIELHLYDQAVREFRDVAARHPWTLTSLVGVQRRIDDLQAKLGKSGR